MSRLPSWLRGRMAIVVVGGSVAALYLLLLLGSFLDGSFAGDRVGRNITFASHSASGLDEPGVAALVHEHLDGYGTTVVEIDAGFGAERSTAAELGLNIDPDRSVDRVLDANQATLVLRPLQWIGSFIGTTDVEPVFSVEDGQLRSELVQLDVPGITEWTLPEIDADADGVRVVSGISGTGIDPTDFAERLVDAAESADGSDSPLQVEPELVDVDPPVSDEEVAAVAADAAEATATTLGLTVGETEGEIPVEVLRSWLVLDVEVDEEHTDAEVQWAIDGDLVDADLEVRFAEAGARGEDVAFEVVDGQVQIAAGAEATVCCADDSAERIERALRDRIGQATLELDAEETSRGQEWAESLGIIEEVASFTTNHACCQNRVTNIQLIADATRGVVIEPGETFSLNDHVGRRTAEKGYLPAGGIVHGVLVDQLGGGISQFTTTLFNAAFFAGLDFGEYQAHSIYFSRYPYGREATLSFPAPDLQIRNTSPYGVLIWPTYTDTSITVTLYSTRHVSAEQTGQTLSEQGVCTRVRTERTRTYDDGEVVVDHVGALYRPSEGLNCDGESSVPTEPEPEPEPEPPPPPPPPPDEGDDEDDGEENGGDDG